MQDAHNSRVELYWDDMDELLSPKTFLRAIDVHRTRSRPDEVDELAASRTSPLFELQLPQIRPRHNHVVRALVLSEDLVLTVAAKVRLH